MLRQSSSKNYLYLIIIVLNSFTLSLAQSDVNQLPQGVSVYVLDNGLEVLLIEKPTLPMVGINTVVKVGSAYENFSTSGMSHMLEHLLFNGTTSMTQKQLYDSTDMIGGYNNAHTGEYFTNYMMVTPYENILDGMKLQSSMLLESILPEEKFEKEKGIVLEEIAKSLANSNEQMERNILSVIYAGHALSLPTLGTYSTIKNMNRDHVFDFYKNFYVPNNMIISVIGNFNSKEMLSSIKEIYGKYEPKEIKPNLNTSLAYGFTSVEIKNRGKVFHRFYDGKTTQLQLFFDINDLKYSESLHLVKLWLDTKTNMIKNDLKTSFGEEVEGLEFGLKESPILNYIQVTLSLRSDEKLSEIKKVLLEKLFKLNGSVAPETVENELIKSKTRFLKNTEKPHMFGIYNAALFAEKGIEGILSSYTGEGYYNSSKELKGLELSEEYITIIQHPAKNEEKAKETSKRSASIIKLPNGGAELISKTAKGSNLLAIHYMIKNKAELETKYGKDAAKVWHDAFGQRMDSPEIQKLSNKFGFTFTVNDNPFIPMDNIYLSPEFGYIRIEGLASDVKSAIEFLNQQFLAFTPTQEEFDATKGKSKMPSMMGKGNAAKKMFDAKLENTLYEKSPNDGVKSELSFESLLQFGKEYFIPSNMIISVVSPEDGENINQYFKSFVGAETTLKNKLGFSKGFNNLTVPVKIDIEGKGEQSYLYYGFQKNIESNEVAELKVLSLLLADEIIFDIREKQGMAYRMSAGVEVKKSKAMFYINMGTRPENVDKLIPQFPSFFSKEFSTKISDSGIKRAVNMYLGRMMFRRLSSINQAYYLGHSQYFKGDIAYDEKSLEDLKNVTTDDVVKVAQKYLEVENPIEIYVR